MPLSDSFFSNLSGAVGDVFGAVGQFASAKGYKQAAQFAEENAAIAGESAKIQQLQAQRQIYRSVSTAQANIAANGLATSGSAQDILRDSAQQGALTKQLVAQQGAINVLGYEAEAASYSSMASAAKASGIGGLIGGAIKIGAMFLSDDRLKTDAKLIERRPDGLGIWEFAYKGSTQRFRGVMASEVERIYPQAVKVVDGLREVDYALIGVEPQVV